jgi:hypothetical protein
MQSVNTLISAVIGFGSALLAILITPPLQHHFWKRQRYAEVQLKVADEVNDIAANFYMVHTSSGIATYKLTEPFLTQILIVRGKVKPLFSGEAFERFKAMETRIATTGSPSRGLGPEGKIGAHEILERADQAVQTLYHEVIGRSYRKAEGEVRRDSPVFIIGIFALDICNMGSP